jgi:hypothetical protein
MVQCNQKILKTYSIKQEMQRNITKTLSKQHKVEVENHAT